MKTRFGDLEIGQNFESEITDGNGNSVGYELLQKIDSMRAVVISSPLRSDIPNRVFALETVRLMPDEPVRQRRGE